MGRFIPNPALIPSLIADVEFQAAMEFIGTEALQEAKQRAPVATGALRDSMRVERLTNGGRRISVNVDYWGFPEYGTEHMDAEPYLRPTLTAMGLRITV